MVNHTYALDDTKSENEILMGRASKPIISTTKWQDDRLIIESEYPFQDSRTGEWLTSKVIHTLWLEPPTGTPWEARLIVETTRVGLFDGSTSTNRTYYTKGYR